VKSRRNAFEKDPWLSPVFKRQLTLMVVLLVLLVGMSYRLVVQLASHQASSPREGAAPGNTLPSSSLGVEAAEEDALTPLDPEPPEPFKERPEILAAAAARDGTADLDDEATIYFFQRILTDPDSFRSEPPALSLRGDDAGGGTDGKVWEHLLADPDRYRGALVEVYGVLVSPDELPHPLQLRGLPYPNPSGRDRAFASYLYGTDDRYYIVASLEPHPEFRHRDRVHLRAYFCQLYTNDVEIGGETRKGTVPYLVGEAYDNLETTPNRNATAWTIYLPIIVLLPSILFMVMFVLRRRTATSYERRRRQSRAVAKGRAPAPPETSEE
jgi:hypothetical protein